MITQDCAVVRSGDRGSQGRLNDLLDTRTSSSDFRDTVVEVEIFLGSYDGQFNSAILLQVSYPLDSQMSVKMRDHSTSPMPAALETA